MGWLEDYLEYTQDMESPRVFHYWSAVALLGHVLGRRCWVDRGGRYKIYPGQIMVILCARSAIARKSTAVLTAVPFLNCLPEWAACLLPSKLSPQQLIHELNLISMDGSRPKHDPWGRRRDSCGLIAADELGFFFTSEEFARALPTHICAFNDAPLGNRRFAFRAWGENVWNACVGMLGATTPKGFADELPEPARQAGFLGRCIVVWGDPKGRANPLTDEATGFDKDLKLALEQEIQNIAQLHGEFRWSRSGKRVFDEFYHEHHEWVKKNVDTGLESDDTGYFGRKGDHVIRVATVVSASSSDEQLLRGQDVEKAITALGEIEKDIPRAFSEVGVARNARIETRILGILKKRGDWIPKWYLSQMVRRYGDKRTRDLALDTLLECREIDVERRGGTAYIRRRP